MYLYTVTFIVACALQTVCCSVGFDSDWLYAGNDQLLLYHTRNDDIDKVSAELLVFIYGAVIMAQPLQKCIE